MTAPLVSDVLAVLMAECGFSWFGRCAGCGSIIFRRRGPKAGQQYFCPQKKCQAIRGLGHDKPVTLDGVPSDFSHSPQREIGSYHGGYSD